MANSSTLLSAALTRHRAGELTEAASLYGEILLKEPNHADALHLLGVLCNQVGDANLAVTLITRSIEINPGVSDYHNNLGNAFKACGDSIESEKSYSRAIALNARSADAYLNLGILLEEQGRLEEAKNSYRRALRACANMPGALLGMGNVAVAMGDGTLGVKYLKKAIQFSPNHAVTQNAMGNARFKRGENDLAKASYLHAIKLDPACADFFFNLGNVHFSEMNYAMAIDDYERSVALSPLRSDVHNNMGFAHMRLGNCEAAIRSFVRAIEISPSFAEAHFNLGTALLMHGDYVGGFREYEWRWQWHEFPSPKRNFEQPLWQGEPLAGRSILLHAEQGFGDTIQFVRYASLVAQRGGHVILEVQSRLKRLLERLPGIAECIQQGDPLPPFSCHCPLLSLPFVFGTTVDSVPPFAPDFAAEMALDPSPHKAHRGCLRVGLVWAGSPTHRHDALRSVSLSHFLPLTKLDGVSFVSLQKGPAAAQAGEAYWPLPLPDACFADRDFADTAAIVANLDLVITVDTAIAHLAGAMGKPVWILLSHVPDWRWGLRSETTPWYPSARLFRSLVSDDWERVMERVASELAAYRDAGQK